jgi:hypothetical protein
LSHENGPKDIGYVGENETVRVLAKFGPREGGYIMHCLDLVEDEDNDMVTRFEVREKA